MEVTGSTTQGSTQPPVSTPIIQTGQGEGTEPIVQGEGDAQPSEPKLSEIDLAKKFNLLTAKEKQLLAEKEALKREKEAGGSFEQKYNELLQSLKTSPIEFLQQHGFSFKDLAAMILNDNKPTVEQKLKSLEDQILEDKRRAEEQKKIEDEERQKKLKETEDQRHAEVINKAKESLKETIDASEEFELVRAHGAYDQVWDVIQAVYDETKKVISFEEAAKHVEDDLFQKGQKFFETNKFKQKYQPAPIKEEFEMEDVGHNHYYKKLLEERYGRTLGNDMMTDGAGTPQTNQRPYLDDDESKAYLAKKLAKMLQGN